MKNQLFKKISIGLIGIYLIGFLINSLSYQNFFTSIQNNTWILEYFISAVVIVLYMIDILRSDAILKLKKIPQFWIGMGYFFTALILIPVLIIARFIEWTGIFDFMLLGSNIVNVFCVVKAFLVTRENFKDGTTELTSA